MKCAAACRALRSSRAPISIDIIQRFLLALFVTKSVFLAIKSGITVNLAKLFQRDLGNGARIVSLGLNVFC